MNSQENKFYADKRFIILMLIFLTPIGLFLMFKYTKWNKVLKIVLTPILLFYSLIYIGFISVMFENFNTDLLTGSIFLIIFLWILIISITFTFSKNKNLKTSVTIILTIIAIFSINKISRYVENKSIQANKIQIDRSIPKREGTIGTSNKIIPEKLSIRNVRNDVTGNWRITTIANSSLSDIENYAFDYYHKYFKNNDEIHAIINFSTRTTNRLQIWITTIANSSLSDIENYAFDYYHKYFKNNDEIHAIINFSTRTTNRLQISGNSILVTIHEYEEDEEHDAKELFKGDVLSMYTVYADNGDIERIK